MDEEGDNYLYEECGYTTNERISYRNTHNVVIHIKKICIRSKNHSGCHMALTGETFDG